ncbi:MAG: hypothetical protein IJD04_06600, partial [Desulfovibrionaceae bacterium]|nr:hypothetical protein [Desulfovibrionaceae bacterium]
GDGRIRVPELLAAVEWACARLKDPASMIESPAVLPLAAIDDASPEGVRIRQTAQAVLASLDKAEASEIGLDDMQAVAGGAAGSEFNGDGVLPPLSAFAPEVRRFIQAALEVIGGVKDGSGEAGINISIAEAFVQAAKDWRQWEKNVSNAEAPLGRETHRAWVLMQELKPKLDDYFLRCELASYAPQSTAALNPAQEMFVQQDNAALLSADLKDFPLSLVEANRPLNLEEGLNPAWRPAVEEFFQLVAAYLDRPARLTRNNWLSIQKAFEGYAGVYAQKPSLPAVDVEFPPQSGLDTQDAEFLDYVLSSDVPNRFKELAEKDAGFPAAAADIADLERLIRYHRQLHRLLLNFVSLREFYAQGHKAAFQAGTLYIDGKSCLLCVPVSDINTHSALAAHSELFLLYLKCTRKAAAGSKEPEGERMIAAAITGGGSELLMEGRNGVFIDNQGFDWDARVVKVISKPVSLWDAVWEPYRKMAAMVSEQINKLAASKQQNVLAQTQKNIAATVETPAAPAATAAAPKFDIARSAGIFAAIGLALGALGTALASIARAVFALQWWQFPLVIIGIFLVISGPSVVIAWFKLRARTLGPLLEASGWATNNRLPINISLAGELTFSAKLPSNAQRSFKDPLHKPRRWPVWALIVSLLASCIIGCLLFYKSQDADPAGVNATSAVQTEIVEEDGGAASGN